ncbi:hypothetical protein V6N12_026137 [Hibiscus sabdariffa]|uniref:Uncharacterized protein n=1 Tax=Hibiscus sabdariffa TaxID=183260 RepID=A0ABR2DQX4_9ROSI
MKQFQWRRLGILPVGLPLERCLCVQAVYGVWISGMVRALLWLQGKPGGVENDEMRVVEESGQGDIVDFAARGLVVGAKTTLDSDSKGRLVSECNSNEVPRPVSVSTIVNGESWDWNRLQGWLPLPILEKLEACPIPKTSFGDDVPGWRWTENRCFTVGSAYEHLVTEEARNGGEFFTQPFELWLMNNLFLSTSWGGSSSNWGMRFAIWCWLLWKLRCSMIFDDDFSEREDLLHRELRLITECERVFGMTVPARVTEVRTPVRWEQNGVADSLAAMGRLHGRSGVGFISPPDGVLSRLDSERTERLVEESFADLDSSRGRETGLVFDPGG